MKMVLQVVLAATAVMFCTVTWALEVYLPEGQQTHTLDIDTDENVVLYVSNDAILGGTIKTDYNITIIASDETKKKPSISLNPTLKLLGHTHETPYDFTIEKLGDTYINTPLKFRGSVNFLNSREARIEINSDMNVLSVSRYGNGEEDNANANVFIKSGVTLDISSSWNTDLGKGSFYLSGGSVINTGFFNVSAANQITCYGDLNTGSLGINGSDSAQVQLHNINANSRYIGGFAFNYMSISGRELHLHKDITSSYGSLSIQGHEINLYGVVVTAVRGGIRIGAPRDQTESRFNAYGGVLKATQIDIESDLIDYGLELELIDPMWQ